MGIALQAGLRQAPCKQAALGAGEKIIFVVNKNWRLRANLVCHIILHCSQVSRREKDRVIVILIKLKTRQKKKKERML